MGYYIQGPTKGKADFIVKEHGATKVGLWPPVWPAIPEGKALICVVDNGAFEAAAFCFDESEYRCFNDPTDWRFKEWLLMDQQLASQLSGYKE